MILAEFPSLLTVQDCTRHALAMAWPPAISHDDPEELCSACQLARAAAAELVDEGAGL